MEWWRGGNGLTVKKVIDENLGQNQQRNRRQKNVRERNGSR